MSNINVDSTTHIEKDIVISSNYTSFVIDYQQIESFSFQFSWKDGSSITGTTKIEVSLDKENFVPMDASLTKISGTTGTHVFDVSDVHYRYMRFSIDLSAGSSTFNIYFNSRSRRT